MNKRIDDLLKQATDNILGVPVVDQKKFAELIVRECMNVANTYQNRGSNCYVDDMIAEHFGVEE
jgi:hypothetical protein